MIPLDHAKNVCKAGQGEECCRYLSSGITGLICLKLDSVFKEKVDERVANGYFIAKSDNCEGIKL